ncbi:N5-glutamine S-adenosyl-L-methionine-dependent methyltransferase [Enterobacter cancerogenus]|uniref:N5-glutamine S-adenosyl-L-methionine-dependent methyltransferase n=1 Tax=Enterobacter cancerogenus TaxID=69218 RepID=A0A484W5B4_9ENTR|nr:N5-glutamine S-adenosyl-L-methionine-dependent methyltransferase [Enterobacter cancerogenus]
MASGEGLADLDHIVTTSRQHLLHGGWLLVEHGWTQGEAVRDLFTRAGYTGVETCRDYGGNERLTLGQWA